MDYNENNVAFEWGDEENDGVSFKDFLDDGISEKKKEKEEDEDDERKIDKDDEFFENDDENSNVSFKDFIDEGDEPKEDEDEKEDTDEDSEGEFSDFLKYCKENALPEIEDEQIKNCKSVDDLNEIIQSVVEKRLDEETKAARDAMRAHQDPNGINTIKNTINFLDNVTDDYLENEDDERAAELRKNIIIDYYMKKGSTKEEALEEYQEIYDAGKEVEKSKKLLPKVKDEYNKQLKSIQDNINKTLEEEKKAQEEEIANFKKAILEEKTAFGDLDINKETKNKIFDYATKPAHKDPKDPKKFYTELDWQIMQNPIEWKKMMALVGVITDGGKNLNNIAKVLANKEVKKEQKNIANSLRNGNFKGGNMNLAGEYKSKKGERLYY